MFELPWSHMMLFGLAAIVLIPSKDLPKVLRQVGKYWGDIQRMAHEFRRQVSEALNESELKELKDSLAKEAKDIQSSVDISEEQRKLDETMAKASVAPVAPAPVAASEPPATAPLAAAPEAAPSEAAAAPSAAPRVAGIEIVRAGRGSVAQRAAKAWKKSPAGAEAET